MALRVHSSLLPSDEPLCDLLRFYHFKEFFCEEEVMGALDAVESKCSAPEAIRHLPVVLNALLRIMASRSNGARPCEVLVSVLVRISRELGCLLRPRQVDFFKSFLSLFISFVPGTAATVC